MVEIVVKKEIVAARETGGDAAAAAEAQRLTKEHEAKFCNPYKAAARGYVDAVIESHSARRRPVAGQRLLSAKRYQNPPEKHGNLPRRENRAIARWRTTPVPER